MTHAAAVLQLGTAAAAVLVLAAIFGVDPAVPVVLAAIPMVGPVAVIPVAADLLATSAEDPGVVVAVPAGATDTVAVATVVVSAAATGGIHARRHLHVSRRATAPWRRP